MGVVRASLLFRQQGKDWQAEVGVRVIEEDDARGLKSGRLKTGWGIREDYAEVIEIGYFVLFAVFATN